MKASVNGFTLIEVLVALVIFAVGLLGIAALHIESLNAGRTALNRTQAVELASDLADRIRANRLACSDTGCAYEGAGALTASCETTAGCTPAELAATDVFRWRTRGAAQLPGFASAVDYTFRAGLPGTYLITVQWVEPGSAAAASYSLRLEI
jgi:type IV pilus assembly protein PilV